MFLSTVCSIPFADGGLYLMRCGLVFMVFMVFMALRIEIVRFPSGLFALCLAADMDCDASKLLDRKDWQQDIAGNR